jgi:polar amino acid transport system substrate-binding protein
MSRHRSLIAVAVAAALLVAACGDDDDAATTETTAGGGDAAGTVEESDGDCPTITEGVLTVATDSPAFPPWVIDDDPTTGEGFESAVAYAVAGELGFSEDQVEWTRTPFNTAIAPGEKDFDFYLAQVSISEERDQAVDFSNGYYEVNQAMVGFADSPAASATTVEDLRSLRFGAQVGTTSLDFITEQIQPEQEPLVYNDNAAAKAALDAQQVDAIVLDLPTAFFVSSVEIEGTAVIGQFPSVGGAEEFGLVFDEGNPLRDCVNTAVDALRESGELEAIEQEWLSDTVEAPVIELEG